MNILKRIFKIGQAELHHGIDQVEDPVKMTEQGIRDLKTDLHKSIASLAEIKGMAIRTDKDLEKSRSDSSQMESKAILLVQKADAGEVDKTKAEMLAKQALGVKKQLDERVDLLAIESEKLHLSISQLQKNVDLIKENIYKWENELKTLKARSKVSEVTQRINKQIANVDSHGTISTLERMKDKVNKQEAIAHAYGEMASIGNSIESEIESTLSGSDSVLDLELEELRKKIA